MKAEMRMKRSDGSLFISVEDEQSTKTNSETSGKRKPQSTNASNETIKSEKGLEKSESRSEPMASSETQKKLKRSNSYEDFIYFVKQVQ